MYSRMICGTMERVDLDLQAFLVKSLQEFASVEDGLSYSESWRVANCIGSGFASGDLIKWELLRTVRAEPVVPSIKPMAQCLGRWYVNGSVNQLTGRLWDKLLDHFSVTAGDMLDMKYYSELGGGQAFAHLG